MKAYFLPVLIALAMTVHADPPKQMAFGSINFGDSLEQVQKETLKMAEDQSRRRAPLDAREIVRNFVIKGTKYPAKLATKYSATGASTNFNKFPVTEVWAQTTQLPAADYATKTREDWEVMQDIALSKFGVQKSKSDFPAAADNKEVVTDTWDYSGLQIRLLIKPWPIPGAPKYSVILSASRP